MKESFSHVKHGHSTAFNFGGPIYAIPLRKEGGGIIDLDNSVHEYKEKYKERLNKVWEDAIKETQPYRFDEAISGKSSRN